VYLFFHGSVKSLSLSSTELLSWLLFLNFATTIMSVNPPISYTAQTFGNLAMCFSTSATFPLTDVTSIIAAPSIFIFYYIRLSCLSPGRRHFFLLNHQGSCAFYPVVKSLKRLSIFLRMLV
jgi:hypothetical protein